MTRIVGVHGIRNHHPDLSRVDAADRIAQEWLRGLHAGPGGAPGADLAVAYYADLLHPGIAQGEVGVEDLTADEGRLLLAWTRALGAPAEVGQGRATQPLRQAAAWIAGRFGLDAVPVRAIVSAFCWEVERYLSDAASCRQPARDAVMDAVTAHEADVVIAHSLGSVVAYEALWQHNGPDVPLLITVGSPLAMPDVVLDRLDPAVVDGRGRRPPCVRRWVNLADHGDIVAVPRWLSRRFDGVDLDAETSIGVVGFHRAPRYLATKEVAEALDHRH